LALPDLLAGCQGRGVSFEKGVGAMRQVVDTGVAAPGPFSVGVYGGGLLFVSGQVGVDPVTDTLVPGGVAAQAEQALANLDAIVRAAGRTLGDVVRVGVYLADIADWAAVNEVYAKAFGAPYPARTAVAVAGLPLDAAVEFDAVVG
jgi:2-iminobutanoate/2-iminopropanoate deaminase